MRRQFEEYMHQKDTDMTTKGELHLVRCLSNVVMEIADNLDSESKDLAKTIAGGIMSQMEERLDLLYRPHSEIIDRFFPGNPSDGEAPEPDTIEGLTQRLLKSDTTMYETLDESNKLREKVEESVRIIDQQAALIKELQRQLAESECASRSEATERR